MGLEGFNGWDFTRLQPHELPIDFETLYSRCIDFKACITESDDMTAHINDEGKHAICRREEFKNMDGKKQK